MLHTENAKLNAWNFEFIVVVLCSLLVPVPPPATAVHQAQKVPLIRFILLKEAKKQAAGLEML